MLLHSFGNSHNVLIMRSRTKVGFPRETRFWAERGLIHCEDNVEGYSSMSVRTFLKRVNALNEMLGSSNPSRDSGPDADLRQLTQRHVEKATEIARQAQIQGMPEDASARRDLVRRRPKTICLSEGKGIL